MSLHKIFLFTCNVICLFLISCSSNPLDVDVSKIDVSVNVKRLDRAIFEEEINENTIEKLRLQFGLAFDIFEGNILYPNRISDSSLMVDELSRFSSEKVMKGAYQSTKETFGNLSQLKYQLDIAFRYIKYYFPNHKVPVVITFPSAFNSGVFSSDGLILIGLEMYLGQENEYIKGISTDQIPNYIKRLMTKEFLITDIMRSWIDFSLMDKQTPTDFLGTILRQGKIMYAAESFLRNTEGFELMRYTKNQLDWCNKSESSIWNFLVDNNYLFTTNPTVINQFVNDAPFTTGLPQDSPPRVGVWLGWKIIQAYMLDNPDVGLPQLLTENDNNKILKSYKPNK